MTLDELIIAALNGVLTDSDIEGFIKDGGDINARNDSEMTVLLSVIAAERGHDNTLNNRDYNMYKLLKNHGADTHLDGAQNCNALFYAASEEKAAIVLDLLDDEFFCKSENLNRAGEDCMSPLIAAARYESDEVIPLLLSQPKISIDAIDYSSSSALIWAANKGFREIVRDLLHAGADHSTRNSIGHNADYYFAIHGWTDLLAADEGEVDNPVGMLGELAHNIEDEAII